MRSKTTRYLPPCRLDESNQVQRAHLGAVLFGARNVVDVEAVLRAHVAADVAVAEMDAGALALAVRVDELAASVSD